MKYLNVNTLVATIVLTCICLAGVALAQSARVQGPAEQYNITSYPLYGRVLSPSDSEQFATPGFVRADAAGTIKVECQGNPGNPITLNVVAGEFVPCKAQKVWATGTSATPLHLFY